MQKTLEMRQRILHLQYDKKSQAEVLCCMARI